MNYNISSDKFQHPLLKPILTELSDYFKDQNINFYVIGATARDIILSLHDEKSARLTQDLDIAIAISNWAEYQIVEDGLVEMKNFEKDKDQKQRFIYKKAFKLDIVPYGKIMDEDDKIFWPPDESIAMSGLGFEEVKESTQKIMIDDKVEIKVATLEGIFLLKVFAWMDRNLKHDRDADDMGFIINNYLNIHEARAATEYYDLIYPYEDFTTSSAGAKLLGIDLSKLLNDSDSTKHKVIDLLTSELNFKEESRLLNQILETHKNLSYEDLERSLKNLILGLETKTTN